MFISVALVMWYNDVRFGRLVVSSYGGSVYHTPLVTGLEGLLVSPGRSVFLYNPLAVLGVVGLVSSSELIAPSPSWLGP